MQETVDPSIDLILLACSTMLAKMNISKCSFNIIEAKMTARSSTARRREDFHQRFRAPAGALHRSRASTPVVAACDDVRSGARSMTNC